MEGREDKAVYWRIRSHASQKRRVSGRSESAGSIRFTDRKVKNEDRKISVAFDH